MPFLSRNAFPVHPDLRSRLGVIIPFAIVSLIWGSTWLVIKDQVSTVPPPWTATWRFAAAAAGMVVLALVRRESLRIPREVQKVAAFVGLFQFCFNFQLIYRAETFITSGVVAMFFALLIVPNALFARVFLKAPIGARFVAGSVVALAGIAMLILHEYRAAPPHSAVLAGVVMCVVALTMASAANVMQATRAAQSVSAAPLLAWAMIWATVGNIVVSLVLAGPPVFDPRPRAWLGVAYLSLVGSVLTFPLYFNLIRKIGPGKAAYHAVVVPIIAMLLSTLFEGYRWTLLASSGAVLAFAGVLIALSSRRG